MCCLLGLVFLLPLKNNDRLRSREISFSGGDRGKRSLGAPSISILSRDPNLFRKPKFSGNSWFLKRTMLAKNGIDMNPYRRSSQPSVMSSTFPSVPWDASCRTCTEPRVVAWSIARTGTTPETATEAAPAAILGSWLSYLPFGCVVLCG